MRQLFPRHGNCHRLKTGRPLSLPNRPGCCFVATRLSLAALFSQNLSGPEYFGRIAGYPFGISDVAEAIELIARGGGTPARAISGQRRPASNWAVAGGNRRSKVSAGLLLDDCGLRRNLLILHWAAVYCPTLFTT